MKENQKIQDKIDRFLLGQMSTDEKKNFTSEMNNNPDLKRTVDTQKLIVDEINERESFMAILNDAENSEASINDSATSIIEENTLTNTHKLFDIDYRWTISIAAAILGLVFIIWQPHKTSNNGVYSKYALAYAGSNLLESDNNVKTRGGAIYFENLNPTENQKIDEALSFYYKEEYSKAKTLFEQVLVPREKNTELVLYMAISELYSNDFDKAINNLRYLNNLNDYIFKEPSAFYLALAYIKTNQIHKARKLLNDLRQGDSEYASQANEMLTRMRWF